MIRPYKFKQDYIPITVYTEDGVRYVKVRNYVSGNPWKKQWPSKAVWDLMQFYEKRNRYKDGKNCNGWHDAYGGFFFAESLYPQKWVEISWKQLQLCFYGKGSPATFQKALKVVAYYLKHADVPLGTLGWSKVMDLEEYAKWYFGIDCNGFAGEFYAKHRPGVGINGGDHINFLKDKGTLTKRDEIADIEVGDILVREGSSGGGKRHVALIDTVSRLTDTDALSMVSQSSSSKGGLCTEFFNLKKLNGSSSDGFGKLGWKLAGYHSFHYILGPN